MRVGNCPNCGAEVRFHSAGAAEVVCQSCRSILLAREASLEKVGLAADVASPGSLIQIGAAGSWRGNSFIVTGQVVYESDEGAFNEWYVVFRNGAGAWIPDARQLYSIVFLTPPPEPLAVPTDPEQLPVFHWRNTHFYMTTLRRVRRVGCEGELGPGAHRPAELMRATLLDPEGRAGVIRYEWGQPQLFLGAAAEFDDLHWSNLRSGDAAAGTAQTRALNCPNCGGALTLRTGGLALSLGCPHCLSLFDATQPELAPLRKFEQAQRIKPILPLGAHGQLDGDDFEVVGFQVRTSAVSMGAFLCEWHQYVLFHPRRGFRFLTQQNGHWSESRFSLAHPEWVPGASTAVVAFGERYRHFSVADAETTYVQGEFPWRLVVDEAARVTEYIRPPFLLASDSTIRETTWFQSEYRTGREIWNAFQLEGRPPTPVGIAANQPRPAGDLALAWAIGVILPVLILVGGLFWDTFVAPLPRGYWAAGFVPALPALLLQARASIFERRRWRGSDHDPNNARFRQANAGPYVISERP